MRKIYNFLIVLALLFLLTISSSYAQSVISPDDKTSGFNYNETTGIVNIPNARIINYKTMKLSIRLAKLGYKEPARSTGSGTSGTLLDSDFFIRNDGDRRLLISPIRNVEINLMNLRSRQFTPVIAAKILAIEETKSFPAIAVGVHNATGVTDDLARGELAKINSKAAPFIVASKCIGNRVDLTVGYGGGRFRNRVFYGGEIFLDNIGGLRAVGEYDGNITSYGFKYRLPKGRWDFGAFYQQNKWLGVTFDYCIPW